MFKFRDDVPNTIYYTYFDKRTNNFNKLFLTQNKTFNKLFEYVLSKCM